MKKVIIFSTCLITVLLTISLLYGAEPIISGITKSFDAKTGILVIQTTNGSTATFSVPQTVKVYIRAKGRDIEVLNSWQVLRDNLIKGTKVQILSYGGVLNTIWLVEVPR
jgi:hypothetical protein